MILEFSKRMDRKILSRRVAEDRYAFVASTKLVVRGLEINIKCLSNTIFVVTHVSQKPICNAAIIWMNEPSKGTYDFPVEKTWDEVRTLLNTKYYSITKRNLSDRDLNFLGMKMFGPEINHPSQLNGLNVTWTRFALTKLVDTELFEASEKDVVNPNFEYSFWVWFSCSLETIKNYLLPYINKGLEIHYIRRAEAINMLREDVLPGKCLFRWSDSKLGGIVMVAVKSHRCIEFVEPFISKHLRTTGLYTLVNDLGVTHIYPHKKREEIFSPEKVEQKTYDDSRSYVKPFHMRYFPNWLLKTGALITAHMGRKRTNILVEYDENDQIAGQSLPKFDFMLKRPTPDVVLSTTDQQNTIPFSSRTSDIHRSLNEENNLNQYVHMLNSDSTETSDHSQASSISINEIPATLHDTTACMDYVFGNIWNDSENLFNGYNIPEINFDYSELLDSHGSKSIDRDSNQSSIFNEIEIHEESDDMRVINHASSFENMDIIYEALSFSDLDLDSMI